jgi:hypothetical protein
MIMVVNCPECGHQLPKDTGEYCPNCGYLQKTEKMLDHIRELARQMRARHSSNDPAYALFLGMGASLAPGALANNQIIEGIIQEWDSPATKTKIDDERIEAFFILLDHADQPTRYNILSQFLGKAVPPAGYKHLANLIVNGYFRTIITSGFDPFLEAALYDAGLWSRDLYINYLQQGNLPARQKRKKGIEAPFNLTRLHGDPYSEEFWTSWKELNCSPRDKRVLSEAMARDLVMVGYHPRDSQINPFLESGDGELVYVNPFEPGSDHPLYTITQNRSSVFISGEYGHFDTFFGSLADLLLYRSIAINQNINVIGGSASVIGVEISQVGGQVTIQQDLEEISDSSIGARLSSDPIQMSEMKDPKTERLDSLRSQLYALEQNYKTLQQKAAMYGTGNTPTRLQIELDAVRNQMAELNGEIASLSNQEG